MGIVKRQSIKGIAIFVIGAAIHFMTMLILMPNILSESDQALYRVYFSLIVMATSAGAGGVHVIIMKHYNNWQHKPEVLKTFNTINLFMLFCLCTLMVLGLYGCKSLIYSWKGNSSPLLLKYFWVVPFSAVFSALIIYFEAYSISTHRLTAPSIVKEIVMRVFLLGSIFLYHLGKISITTFFTFYACSYLLGFLILFFYCYQFRGFKLGFNKFHFNEIAYKQYLPFFFYILIIAVLATFMINSDQVIMYSMQGAKSTDIYGYAVTCASLITIPYKPISSFILPFLYEAWNKNDLNKIKEISDATSKNLSVLGVLLCLLLIINIPLLYSFVPQNLALFKWPLIILGVGRVLDYTTGVSTEILLTAPKYKLYGYCLIATYLFSILMYKLLIPSYYELGAALATAFTLVFVNVLKFIVLKKYYGLQPIVKESIFCILIGVILYLLIQVIPSFENIWVNTIYKSTLTFFTYVILVHKLNLAPQASDAWRGFLRGFKK